MDATPFPSHGPTARPGAWIAPAVWLLAPLLPWGITHGTQLGRGLVTLLSTGAALWWVVGLVTLAVVTGLARSVTMPVRMPSSTIVPLSALALGLWALWPVPAAYLATVVARPLVYLGVCGLIALTAAVMTAGHPRLTLLAVCALLAHSFPLLLVLDLPGNALGPAVGVVMRLGGTDPASPTLAAALCLHLGIAVACAWGVLVAAHRPDRQAA